MLVTFYGHGCFKVESMVFIAFDPFITPNDKANTLT